MSDMPIAVQDGPFLAASGRCFDNCESSRRDKTPSHASASMFGGFEPHGCDGPLRPPDLACDPVPSGNRDERVQPARRHESRYDRLHSPHVILSWPEAVQPVHRDAGRVPGRCQQGHLRRDECELAEGNDIRPGHRCELISGSSDVLLHDGPSVLAVSQQRFLEAPAEAPGLFYVRKTPWNVPFDSVYRTRQIENPNDRSAKVAYPNC